MRSELNRFEGSEQEWERQPLPDGPITVGIDGGYVRAAQKRGFLCLHEGAASRESLRMPGFPVSLACPHGQRNLVCLYSGGADLFHG